MQQLLVRNIDDALKASIRRVAERNGRSMQAEVLDTLEEKYGGSEDDLMDIYAQIRRDLGGEEPALPEREAPRPVPEIG